MRAATPLRLASSPRSPPTSGGGSASPTWRCSVSRSRARRSWPARRSRRECAASTRRPRRRSRARRRSRSRAPGPAASWSSACTAVLDYERAFEWCDRIAEFAERYGSRYMLALLPGRVRRRAPLARTLAGGRDAARSLARGLLPLAPGVGRAARSSGWPSCGAGRAGRTEAARLLDERGRLAGGAALPRPPGARRRRRRPGGRASRARYCVRRRRTASWTAPRPSSSSSAPGSRAASSTRRPRRSQACARSSGWSAPRRFGPAPIWPRACSRQPAATTTAPGRCSRMPWIASRRAARRSRPPGEDRARDQPRRARPSRRGRARGGRGAGAPCSTSGRRAEAERARRLLQAPGDVPLAASGAHAARAGGAAPPRRRPHEPPDRRAAGGERAHRPPPRHEHPAQARPPLADGRGGPRRARGPARAPAHSQILAISRARPKMAGPGEVAAG